MIKIDKIEVFNWEGAIRGMRNPLNSHDKSDSEWKFAGYTSRGDRGTHEYIIGEADLALMRKLCRAGRDHRKFLRQILVSMDITAPLYWWKEFDTYKVGTVANSTSTMHTIHKKPFVRDDFSHEKLSCIDIGRGVKSPMQFLRDTIHMLNELRELYLQTNDKEFWDMMIQLLPQSYNQLRTVTLNYEVLLNMYHARKAHKLDEWRAFCGIVAHMPYFREICLEADA